MCLYQGVHGESVLLPRISLNAPIARLLDFFKFLGLSKGRDLGVFDHRTERLR